MQSVWWLLLSFSLTLRYAISLRLSFPSILSPFPRSYSTASVTVIQSLYVLYPELSIVGLTMSRSVIWLADRLSWRLHLRPSPSVLVPILFRSFTRPCLVFILFHLWSAYGVQRKAPLFCFRHSDTAFKRHIGIWGSNDKGNTRGERLAVEGRATLIIKPMYLIAYFPVDGWIKRHRPRGPLHGTRCV